ncbi:hypothetical protein MKX03_012042 [Papaver bracteatum]|nr:hypothetical protein MKX03_012042 [Papaver bracteatum]
MLVNDEVFVKKVKGMGSDVVVSSVLSLSNNQEFGKILKSGCNGVIKQAVSDEHVRKQATHILNDKLLLAT